MFKRTLLALTLGSCVVCMAQEANQNQNAQPQPADAMVAKFEDGIDQQLQEIALKSGVTKYFHATYVTKIGKSPRDPKYPEARQAAYDRAYANAISQIVMDIQQEMSNAVSHGLVGNSNGLKKADLDPNAAKLINAAIKKELKAQGVDLTNEAAVKAAMPKVANSETLKQTTKAASKLYISGIVTQKTICKGDELGILVYLSPIMRKFAESFITRKPLTGLPKGVNIAQYLSTIPASEISNTFGTRFYLNEKGEPCIVSFYQERVVGNPSIATRTAIRFANAYIQEFVGANVAIAEIGEKASSLSTLEDSMGNTTSVASSSTTFKSLNERRSTPLTYNGIHNVYNRRVRLPSGHRIVIIGRAWCYSAQNEAIKTVEAQGRSQDIRNGAAGGRRVSPKPITPKKPGSGTGFIDRTNDSQGTDGVVL